MAGTAEPAARAPSLPGRRRAARQGGCGNVSATRAACAFPPRPGRGSGAASGVFFASGPPAATKYRGTDRSLRVWGNSSPRAVNHNPADRKGSDVTSARGPPKTLPPLDCASGTFVPRSRRPRCPDQFGRLYGGEKDGGAGRSGELCDERPLPAALLEGSRPPGGPSLLASYGET